MFDVLTVGALVDELRERVLDSRIQKLGLVNGTTIAAELYAHGTRHGFVASAGSERPRAFLTESMPSIDPNLITPFGLQLRKYVRGGFLIGIEQPPLERIIRLRIAKRVIDDRGASSRERRESVDQIAEDAGDDGNTVADESSMWAEDLNRVDLVIEIMGRHSNLILVDDRGTVMESAKRVTANMSRVRPVLPRLPYVPPPVPDKPDPRQFTSASAERLTGTAKPSDKLADTCVRGLRGLSPQMGREIAFQVTGSVSARVSEVQTETLPVLARQVRSLVEPLVLHTWSPCVYVENDTVSAYSAVPLSSLEQTAEERRMPSISTAIEQGEELERPEGPQDHVQRRAQLRAAIGRQCDRVEQRVCSIREQYERAARTDQLRSWGELIYAYLWQIRPGDTELVVDDLRIPLDPALSAKENAAAYFEDYRKSQKAAESLPARIAEGETEVEYLQQVDLQAGQADGFAGVEAVRMEFEEHTGGRQPVGERNARAARAGKRSGSQAKRQPALTDAQGNAISIGRSGRENDHVTFELAGADDTWLHARGVPGSHVIIRWQRPAEDEDPESVATGAALAAWYSGSRSSGSVEVDVTRRRHVRKIRGAGPGMVTYRQEHTIAVAPMNEDQLRSEGRLL